MQNVIFGATDIFGTGENAFAPNAGPSIGEEVSGGKGMNAGNPALVWVAMIALLFVGRLIWEAAKKPGG